MGIGKTTKLGGKYSKSVNQRGQAMTEYIVVSMGILLAVFGTHSAWEAYNSNRVGGMINGRADSGREYVDVVSGVGPNGSEVRTDAISLQDAIVEKRETFRDQISEITY